MDLLDYILLGAAVECIVLITVLLAQTYYLVGTL